MSEPTTDQRIEWEAARIQRDEGKQRLLEAKAALFDEMRECLLPLVAEVMDPAERCPNSDCDRCRAAGVLARANKFTEEPRCPKT